MEGWPRVRRNPRRRRALFSRGTTATGHRSPQHKRMPIKMTVNNQSHELDIDPNMPLLRALRDHLQLTGTKFGCGMALCGACTVHIDGQASRSCVTPVSAVIGKKVTTIEGLDTPAGKAVQSAWVGLDVPQCGSC